MEEASKKKPTRYGDLQRICSRDPLQGQTEKASRWLCLRRSVLWSGAAQTQVWGLISLSWLTLDEHV